MVGLVFVAEAAEVLEAGAGGFGVVEEWGDGHEAAEAEVRKRGDGGEESWELFRSEAVLGVFGGEFDLDEDGEGFVQGCGGLVEAGGGFEGVEGVDGREELGGFGGFVVLERADEMEAGIRDQGTGIRKNVGFGLPFLDAVFAEEGLAGGEGFEDRVGGVRLADGHEVDGGGVAVGAGAGVGDFVADAGEVFGDGHAWLV